MAGSVFREDVQTRRYYEFVALQRGVGIHDIHRLRKLPQRAVVALQQPDIVILFGEFLPFDGPVAVVEIKQRNIGNWHSAVQHFLRGGELMADLAHFRAQRNRRSVRSNEGAVIFLLAVERATPLPISHFIGAVRDGLPCHCADLSLD